MATTTVRGRRGCHAALRRGPKAQEAARRNECACCACRCGHRDVSQILAWAALDAGKEVQFIDQFCQPEDHPIRSSFPEGEYLKGLLCRVF